MIRHLISDIPDHVIAAVLSFLMAILRVYMDKSETKALRIIAEGLICVGLTYAATSFIDAMGFSEDYKVSVGVFIGYVGTHSIRILALKLAHKKIDS
jgi:lambda family phage holin